jgi:hypothetical protein
LDLAVNVGNESVSLAWLEDALEYAYAHGQMQTLAYLEAIMEDGDSRMEGVYRWVGGACSGYW